MADNEKKTNFAQVKINYYYKMPTVFIFFGFRFMFYSNDHEPVHIHVFKDGCEAKFNVTPLTLEYNHGFKKQELVIIESVIEENTEVIIERWNAFFKKS